MSAPVLTSPADSAAGLNAIKRLVIDRSGLHYFEDKSDLIADRAVRRMTAIGFRTIDQYQEYLTGDADGEQELDLLINELTIGETYFFREPAQFRVLKTHIIPQRMTARASARRLRIWCAGCSTGAEPYSVAILLNEYFGAALAGWNVTILATDINRAYLRDAADGRFTEWALRSTTDVERQKYFVQHNKTYILRTPFRRMVKFQYHNLISDPCPSSAHELSDFDVVLCRNVMIYFSQEKIRTLVERLRLALAPGAYLLAGASDMYSSLAQILHLERHEDTVVYRNVPQESPQLSLRVTPLVESPPRLMELDAQVSDALIDYQTPLEPMMRAPVTPVDLRRSDISVIPAVDKDTTQDVITEIRAQVDAGNWDTAIHLGRQHAHTECMRPAFHSIMGLIYEHMGDRTHARVAFRRVIYLDKDNVLAHYHLGMIHLDSQQHTAAKRCFRNVLACICDQPDDHPLEEAGELTIGSLREMAKVQLEILHAEI